MPRNTTVYRISVTIRSYAYDMGGFFDMMRYDGSTVESHTWNSDIDVHTIVLKKYDSPHTIERWQSFGVWPTELEPKIIVR